MRSFKFNEKRAREFLPGLLAALAIFVFTGCATTKFDTEDLSADEPTELSAEDKQKALEELRVSSIDVVGEGESVIIATNKTAEYSAFTLTNPLRLVIDLPEANLYDVLDTVKVNNRFLKSINVVTYGGKEKIGRIILELQDSVEHEVKSGEDGLIIELKHDPLAGMPEGYIEDKAVVVASSEGGVVLAENQVEEEALEEAIVDTLDPATIVEGIQSFTEDSDIVIQIVSDGAIGKYNTFELSDPSRVVIDVWDVSNSTGLKVMRVDGTEIKDVRVGNHPDKVRFVIDLNVEDIPPYVITKSGDHITATFSPNKGDAETESASVTEDELEAMALEEEYLTEEDVVLGAADEGEESIGDIGAEVTVGAEVAVGETAAEVAATATGLRAADEDIVSEAEDAATEEDTEVVDVDAMDETFSEENAVEEEFIAEAEGDAEEAVISVDEEVEAFDEEVSDVMSDTDTEIADALSVEQEAEAEVEAVTEEEDAVVQEEEVIAQEEEVVVETEAAPSADEVMEESPAIWAGNNIKKIDYKKTGAKGFLTIETTTKPVYSLKKSNNGRTLVLDISDTLIGEDLVRTLDATKLGTPVATISSYQGSTNPAVTRVLVNLSAKASHSVMEIDRTLSVVFEPAAKPVAVKSAGNSVLANGPEYTGKKIDLDMMDARITDILRLLAEVSNLNIIASDDVTGTISLRLRDVPWDQAFDIILKAKGLDKVKVGNVIRVAPAARISQERDAALAAVKASEKLEPLDIEFVAINYGKAEELEAHVKNVLSERGSITSETRTNTLIIKDITKGIVAAKKLVSRLDAPIPQVLIEARIVEASSSFSRDLGVQWGVDYQTGGNVNTNFFGSAVDSEGLPAIGQSPSTSTNPSFETRNGADNFAVNLPATGSIGTLGALGFILGKAGQNPLVLDLRLSAGEQEGMLRTISRPRVVTLDNKEAKIEDGESIPFETTSASGTSTIFIDANLSLTVTPHITPDGSVLMKIKASKNSIGTFTTASGEPSIVKKEASTEVLVNDGETTVIGGIISSDSNNTESGIPYLKDIPLMGKLFRSKSTKESQKELLIFITPTIMKGDMAG
ncbi:MAG: type IV pilus secretin PilQ [Thermodesulfobacteriota bacterium]